MPKVFSQTRFALTSPSSTEAHTARACPLCVNPGGVLVHRIASLPVHSCLLMDNRREALAVHRGSLDLVLCESCGYLANRAFDESLTAYSARYEDSQAFSGTFVGYATRLAQQWIADWSLAGRTVVEIGAGRGDFSRMLAVAGAAEVISMDPTIDPARFVSDEPRVVPLVQAFRTASDLPNCAAVVMRHVLEHIDDPVAMLTSLRAALDQHPDVPLLVEVPDALRILEEGAFWDVYYEHCAYLTAETARELFESCGFQVHRLTRAYDNQYLLIEATASGLVRPARLDVGELARLAELASGFRETVSSTLRNWTDDLARRRARDETVVVWGSGSKGTAFLIALDAAADAVERVIDINPYLEGKYVAGTGHPIVGPQDLGRAGCDLVIVMNPVYLKEIGSMVDSLSPGSEVVALGK
jgi:hypothetical protein